MYDTSQINSLIYRSLGEIPYNIIRIDKGVMTFKFEFTTNLGTYIIRFYPKSIEDLAPKEYSILTEAYQRHCKVPRVVYISSDAGWHFIIYEKIEGLDMSALFRQLSDHELKMICDAIVDNIKQLSSVNFGFYGALNDDQNKYVNWNAYLKQEIINGFSYLNKLSILSTNEIQLLQSYMLDYIKRIVCSQPQLIWSDFKLDNIIINKKHFAGFIDFEGCMGGDPILSLGYLFARSGNDRFYHLIENNFKKYFSFDFEHVVFYSIFRLLRLAKFLDKPLPTGIKREPVLSYFNGMDFSIKYVLKHQ